MQPNNFSITGHIIDRQTDRGISGLRVEAWDKALFFDDLVGNTVMIQMLSFKYCIIPKTK